MFSTSAIKSNAGRLTAVPALSLLPPGWPGGRGFGRRAGWRGVPRSSEAWQVAPQSDRRPPPVQECHLDRGTQSFGTLLR
jgi:hypothetical protein